ncbi:MAG TPA: divergent polysaccharide deacetylase family protein [Aliidongia sp.]|nr:divergent polysaccharide deacetylase family protein [Aliidongia sp.]
MARTRKAGDRKWQIWLSAAALAAGLGLLVLALWPAERPHPVANAVRPQTQHEHGRPMPDPLAGEPEATVAVPPLAPQTPPPIPPQQAMTPPPVPVPPPPAPAPAPVVAPAPHPAPQGSPPWRRFAAPAGPEDGKPMIAIVIDDMGLDRRHSAEVTELPAPLTLSYMTYAEDLAAQTEAARHRGHEIMLHVPMEPLAAHVDPGPNALRVSLDDAEIRKRLDWGLGRIDGIVGINNHMGSRFTESAPGMSVVMSVLRERGLFFLDSRTTPRSVGVTLAQEAGVPHAARDIFLDDTMTDPAVASELAKTEAVARRTGIVVAIGHPHPSTIEELRRWLPEAEAHGFRLVPMSAIIAHNQALQGHVARD